MRGRALLWLLVGAAVAWPLTSSHSSYTVMPYAEQGCVPCHQAADMRAQVRIDGLPGVAESNRSYVLEVVVNGPQVTPSPTTSPNQPLPIFPPPPPPPPPRQRQGGFTLSADLGAFAPIDTLTGPSHERERNEGENIRDVPLTNRSIGHTGEGSYVRAWKVNWTAPGLPNATIHFHLAGLAANGDGVNGDRDFWVAIARDVRMDVALTPEATPGLHAWLALVPLLLLLRRR